ncbi:hypothetical protein ACOMHN_039471 [Nucella lapillus]
MNHCPIITPPPPHRVQLAREEKDSIDSQCIAESSDGSKYLLPGLCDPDFDLCICPASPSLTGSNDQRQKWRIVFGRFIQSRGHGLSFPSFSGPGL